MGQLWGSSKKKTVTMICDSKSTIKALENQENSTWKKWDPMEAESDLIMSIQQLKDESCNIKRVYKWVRSHQKDDSPITRERRINEEADMLATRCRENIKEDLMHNPKKLFLPASIVGLHINGSLVTKDLKKEVKKAMHDKRMRKFLCKKYGWSASTFDNIDWISTESNLRRKPAAYITAVTKLIHRWQPTNKKIALYKKECISKMCCQCGKLEEQHHYMQCKDSTYEMARRNEWLLLKKKMSRWIDDSVLLAMWYGIQSWINDTHIESS